MIFSATGRPMSPIAQMSIVLAVVFTVLALFIAYLIYENECIRKVRYRYDGAPSGFSGYKIVHISDLHNKRFGKGQKRLLRYVADEKPDMIAVTGDLFQNEYIENARDFMEGAVKIAPVYYVVGNHETLVSLLPEFLKHMREIGVHVLENGVETIERDGDTIAILGLSDPMTFGGNGGRERRRRAAAELGRMSAPVEGFRLLLSHRPEMFEDYVGRAELVLAGHSHAGQVRLPLIGALMTPGEGFKVKYDVGHFFDTEQNTTMFVSGGLGSSNIIPRFHNRPQLVTVELN